MPRKPFFQSPSPSPGRGTTTKNTLKNSLIILEKAVDGLPIPGLKAAAGSLVEVIKIIDKAKQNQDAFQDLVAHLRRLETAISMAFLDYQNLGIPPALYARVKRLSWELSKLANDWQQLKIAHTFTHRFINYEDYSLAVTDMNRRIKESLDTFSLENQIAGAIAVENIQCAVSKHVLSSEIRSLPNANAGYNSFSHEGTPICFEGTREGVLEDFRRWFFTGSTRMYVLLGIAGVGKSTIAQTIAVMIALNDRLAASFFFSRYGGRYGGKRSTSQMFFTSLAYQLAQKSQDFATRISSALQASPDAPNQILSEQLLKLIIEPLEDLPTSTPPVLIVLDALDECEEGGAAQILHLLLTELTRLPFIKIFLTTRPEPHLKPAIDMAYSQDGLVLHAIEASVVDQDIRRFLKHQLSRPEVEKVLPGCGWSCETKDVETLVLAAGRLFIVASTCDKFIKDEKVREPQRQLNLLKSTVTGAGVKSSPFAMLDKLYMQILEAAVPHDEVDEYVIERFQAVVGSIITLQDPLTPPSLAGLLGRPIAYINAIVDVLQSIIVTSPHDPCLRVYHPSFPDFITNPSRCDKSELLIQTPKHHARLAGLCLDLMNSCLKRNICNLTYPSKFMENKDIPDLSTKVKACIPPELAYACSFWAVHLSECVDVNEELMNKLEEFVFNHLLFWMEVLSLISRMGIAYPAVLHAQKFVNHPGGPSELITILNDAQRFVMSSQEIIRMSALHVYYSALPFIPCETLLFEKYEELARGSVKVLMGRDKCWDPLLAVLVGHSGGVNSVASSPDGTRLASASSDKTVRLWDATTGAPLAKLQGHSDPVTSVIFSRDGTHLASASSDNTVRLWDAATGAPLAKLEGHSGSVRSVMFSPDGTRLASASSDKTVRLWDVVTGAPLAELEGHSRSVRSVMFSPDGTRLASASSDKTVRLWDVATGTPLAELEGHSDWVRSVAFSPDGTRLASASDDSSVRLWNAITGAPLAKLQGHSDWATSAVFSPNGTRLASASTDNTVRLWDAITGAPLAKLKGHSYPVTLAVFSPDGTRLASASEDKTVRLWDVATGAPLANLKGHSDWVRSAVFSPDGTRLASASSDTTIRLWDISVDAPLATVEGHSSSVTSTVFSPVDTRIASASDDTTIRLWDAATGAPLAKLEGHSSSISSAMFSPDGTRLASVSGYNTVSLWNATTDTPLPMFEAHSNSVTSAVFSPDGTRIASASYDNTIRLWDVATGALLAKLKGHLDCVRSAAFSPDGARLVSASDDMSVRLWNATTGALLATLKGHLHRVRVAMFSPNGTRLASASYDNTVRLWDAATGTPLAEYTGTLSFASNRALSVSQPDNIVQVLWESDQTAELPLQDSVLYPFHPTSNPNLPSKTFLFLLDDRTRSFVIYNLLPKEAHSFLRVPVCRLPFAFVDGKHDWKGKLLAAGFGNGRMLFLDMSHIVF